jgi:hypothetical protein
MIPLLIISTVEIFRSLVSQKETLTQGQCGTFAVVGPISTYPLRLLRFRFSDTFYEFQACMAALHGKRDLPEGISNRFCPPKECP